MLSRVADSLYWLGRYSERTYTNAYITSVQIDQMLELGPSEKSYEQHWHTILSICGYIDDYESRYEGYQISQMLYYLISDHQNYNSIDSLLTSIRNNAWDGFGNLLASDERDGAVGALVVAALRNFEVCVMRWCGNQSFGSPQQVEGGVFHQLG